MDRLYAIATKKNGKQIKIRASKGHHLSGSGNNPKVVTILASIVTYDIDIVSIEIPSGISLVNINRTSIERIELPTSVKYLICDKEVKGLEKYIGTIENIALR